MRRLSTRTGVSVLLAAALSGSLHGQQSQPAQQGQQPDPAGQITFKSSIEAVTVTASVRDSRGRVVKDLQKAEFEVIDSGFGKEIKDFYAGDSSISLALLLDISGSMAVGGNMDRARDAIAKTTAQLGRPDDEAAFFTFDSVLREVVPFTTDVDKVRRVSLEGKPWGKTSLFDAIATAARTVAERANRHRALLVITDGVDTGSRMSAADVSGIASSINVPVYLLTVVNPVDHTGGEFEVVASDGKAAATATLADLARWTGGDMRIASVPAHTVEAVQDLFAELRHQYLISFEPGARPGWHPIEIRARRKNLIVHARSGYISGPPARSGS